MSLFFYKSFQYEYRKNEDSDSEPKKDAVEEKRAEDGRPEVDDEDNKYRKKKGTEKLSTRLSIVVLLFCFSIFGLVLLMDNRLPKPLTLTGLFFLKSIDARNFFFQLSGHHLYADKYLGYGNTSI